ncbi:hypothetical protein [Sandaracinus amylolyticus]|uniref:hypothetical protein n=1 Tax=Sandaracinus amylolyticus TaxID=927083 RepID=UPI001F43A947|nr:hypothetical protein [Sandaracinus amylolyticus]
MRTSIALALSVIVAAAAGSALRVRSMEHHVASSTYEDVYYVPPPEWLPVFSLGWDEALADLLWARALVYFGDEVVARGGLRHVFDYTDAMLALDPDFRAVYRWIATAGLYRPQAITADDARRTIEYLRRGHQRFPDDGELAWTLGAALAFELPPLLDDPAERDEARSEAAEYLMLAARRGAGPAWLALTNASLLSRVGRAESAADHLEEMYALTDDDDERTRLAHAIAELRSSAYAEGLVEANRREEEGRVREMPYASPAFYFLVGPRPVVRWQDAYRDGFAAHAFEEEREALEAITEVE